MRELDALVVGAGAAGLAAAAELRRHGHSVHVLDAGGQAGGVAQSERVHGYLVERGPNTFRVSAALDAFLREHRLDARLVEARPAGRLRFLVREGRLVAVPLGPGSFLRSPLLTGRGKLRLLAEPFVRRGDPTGESVAEFAGRRLGAEAVERLVGPFLTGIYAGDETQLGAEAVFPSLVAAERARGSIVRGLLASRGQAPRGRPGTWSGRDGIRSLLAPLAEELDGALELETRAEAVACDGPAFRVDAVGPRGAETLRARRLLLATAAPEAAALLRALEPEAARALESIRYAPVASLSLGVDPADVRVPIRGFGYLVPRGEGRHVLGCLFPSQLFPGRAPEGRELLTVLLGGVRNPATLELADDALQAAALEELDRVLGLRGAPERLAVTRWPRAVPQPAREHPRLVADVRARLAKLPALELAGAYLEGVALPDAVASGVAAAERLASRPTV